MSQRHACLLSALLSLAAAAAPGESPPGPAPDLRAWPALPEGRTSFGAVAFDGRVFVQGGHTGRPHDYAADHQRGELLVLEPGASSWEPLAIGQALQGTALVGDQRGLHRIGGLVARNGIDDPADLVSTASVERFDLAARTWHDGAALPAPRSSHDAVQVGDALFVVGGWCLGDGARTWHEDALVLDLAAPDRGWQSFPGPATPRRALALARCGDQVIAIGGMGRDGTQLRSVERLDLATRTWRPGPEFPCEAFGVAATTVGDDLIASARDGVVWRLAAGGEQWERLGACFQPRSFHRLVANGGEVVALGGTAGRSPIALVESIAVARPGARRATLQRFAVELPGRARNRQAMALADGALWLAGGNAGGTQHAFEPEDFVDEIVRVDLATLHAELVGKLPAGCQSQALVEGRGRDEPFLLLGGFGCEGAAPGASAGVVALDGATGAAASLDLRLPEPRTQFHAAWHGDALWIAAGWDFQDEREPQAIYPRALWRSRGATTPFEAAGIELPRPRRAGGAALLDGRWYFAGGLDPEFGPIAPVDVLDLASGRWSTLEAPHDVRVSPELVALRGELLLIGGSLFGAEGGTRGTARVERHRPGTAGWETWIEQLAFPLKHLRALPHPAGVLLVAPDPESPRRLALALLREE